MGNEKKTGSVKIGGNLKKAFRVEGLLIILDLLLAAPVLGWWLIAWLSIRWHGWLWFEATLQGNEEPASCLGNKVTDQWLGLRDNLFFTTLVVFVKHFIYLGGMIEGTGAYKEPQIPRSWELTEEPMYYYSLNQ